MLAEQGHAPRALDMFRQGRAIIAKQPPDNGQLSKDLSTFDGNIAKLGQFLIAADASNQPLTRDDCDKANLPWDDRSNVCVAKSEEAPAHAVSGSKGEASAIDTSSQPLTRVRLR